MLAFLTLLMHAPSCYVTLQSLVVQFTFENKVTVSSLQQYTAMVSLYRLLSRTPGSLTSNVWIFPSLSLSSIITEGSSTLLRALKDEEIDICKHNALKPWSRVTLYARGVLRISSDGVDRRILLGLKFLIPGFFKVGKFGKYFFW